MSTFTPDPGFLFYAECTRILTREIPHGDTVVTEKYREQSSDHLVFRVVAKDDRVVVADVVFGDTYGNKRRILLRRDFKFEPVGPDVVKALGLEA